MNKNGLVDLDQHKLDNLRLHLINKMCHPQFWWQKRAPKLNPVEDMLKLYYQHAGDVKSQLYTLFMQLLRLPGPHYIASPSPRVKDKVQHVAVCDPPTP